MVTLPVNADGYVYDFTQQITQVVYNYAVRLRERIEVPSFTSFPRLVFINRNVALSGKLNKFHKSMTFIQAKKKTKRWGYNYAGT